MKPLNEEESRDVITFQTSFSTMVINKLLKFIIKKKSGIDVDFMIRYADIHSCNDGKYHFDFTGAAEIGKEDLRRLIGGKLDG